MLWTEKECLDAYLCLWCKRPTINITHPFHDGIYRDQLFYIDFLYESIDTCLTGWSHTLCRDDTESGSRKHKIERPAAPDESVETDHADNMLFDCLISFCVIYVAW